MWRTSSQYAQFKRFRIAVYIGFAISPFAGPAVLYIFMKSNPATSDFKRIYFEDLWMIFLISAAVSLILYAYCALVFIYVTHRRLQREFRDNLLLGIAESNVREAEEWAVSGEGDEVGFSSLWIVTQRRLDYYHKIATGQARQSFRNAQFVAGAGFGVLVVTAIAAANSNSTSSSVAAGATGAFGAALGGYLGSTFVRMQQDASMRLAAYFLQPLTFSQALAAERLADTLEGQARDEAVMAIIRSVTQSPAGISDGSFAATSKRRIGSRPASATSDSVGPT